MRMFYMLTLNDVLHNGYRKTDLYPQTFPGNFGEFQFQNISG